MSDVLQSLISLIIELSKVRERERETGEQHMMLCQHGRVSGRAGSREQHSPLHFSLRSPQSLGGFRCDDTMELQHSPCHCPSLQPSTNLRSGIVELVREVKRKSLRRRKLWMKPDDDLQIAECDQNKNFGPFTPSKSFPL